MAIDWLKATMEERRQLYAAIRDVGAVLNMTIEQVINAVLGRQAPIGTDYVANFRKCKIRRSFAKLIHEWIADNHAELGNKHAPDLFPLPQADAWNCYLVDHGIRGELRLIKLNRPLGLVQRKDRKAPSEVKLKLGEEFYFELAVERAAYLTAFQIYKGQNHPIPLGPNDEQLFSVTEGSAALPTDSQGRISPLSETHDTGDHRFLVAIAKKKDHLPTTAETPTPGPDLTVHLIDVLVGL